MEIIRSLLSFEVLVLIILGFIALTSVLFVRILYLSRKQAADPASPDLPEKPSLLSTTHIHAHRKRTLIIICITLCATNLSCWYFIFALFSAIPKINTTNPELHGTFISYATPITFIFSSPVNFAQLTKHINPDSEGIWTYEKYIPWLPFGRKLTFMPNVSFLPDENIMIYLSNIAGILSYRKGGEYLLEFKTPAIPLITAVNPPENSDNVSPNTQITLTLDPKDGESVMWDISINPSQFFTIHRNYYDKLVLDFAKPLQQGTTYTVKIFQASKLFDTKTKAIVSTTKNELAQNFTFTTVKPPLIASFSPEGTQVLPYTPITVKFDEEMDPESLQDKIIITPATPLVYAWNADHSELRLNSTAWKNDTEYSITFPSGISSRAGGQLEQDVEYRFKTVGNVEIMQTEPQNSETNRQVDQPLRIIFNQPVDTTAAESRIKIVPDTPLSFSWEENTVTIKPQNQLAYNSSYALHISAGITGPYGYPSAVPYTYSFTTAPQEFQLMVPYFKQQELFTCNIAATRMMLAYRGISLEESQIKSAVGNGGSRGSGNPHRGYVSDYGTYWDPIIAFISQYKHYRFYDNATIQDIFKELQQGNPVLIWGQNGWSDPHELTWTTPDGQKIYAINGMHSYVVKGYRGPPGNPTHILVNDPWRGIAAIQLDEFERRWNYFRKALVIEE